MQKITMEFVTEKSVIQKPEDQMAMIKNSEVKDSTVHFR